MRGRQLVVPGEIPIKIGCVGEKGIFAWKFVVFLRGEKIEGNNRRRRKRSQSDEGIIFLCERAPQPEAIRFSEAAAAQRRCWEKTNDERKAEKVQANVIIS